MRRISKRSDGENVIEDAAAMQRTMNALRGAALVPRGVYRFERHEEADESMIQEDDREVLTPRLSSTTSSDSAKH